MRENTPPAPRKATANPAPSPAAMRGRAKPSRSVRPVDYTAVSDLALRRARGEEVTLEEAQQRALERERAAHAKAGTPGVARGSLREEGSDGSRSAVGHHLEGEAEPRFESLPPLDLVPAAHSAPSDAVLTINPQDPRPFTRPLTVWDDEVRTVSGASLARITHEIIVLTVADPEDAWTSDNGASDHYMRGTWTVQVRRADNHVIGAFPSAYALAVRPEEAQSVDPSEFLGRSTRRKKGTRHPADLAALKKRLEEHGFTVTASGATHGKITHPDFPGLFTPWASTPSDRRHPQMVTAQVRRVFGIDIRHSAASN